MIRWGKLALVIRGQKSQTSSRNHQAQVHSDQMVLVMARQEAGLCKRRPNSRDTFSDDAQMRVRKQLLAVSWGLLKGALLLMKMMMMGENQSSLSQVYATAILGTDKTLLRT
jgi:hypothetical protein